MECPKCRGVMESINFKDLEIDRCTVCRGLWFDLLEQEDLKKLAGSEGIDTGEAAVGKNYNQVDDYDCPKCQTKMIKMIDLKQRHIWYESCSHCYGVYFDAGEFKDFKEETILDRFKSIAPKKRS